MDSSQQQLHDVATEIAACRSCVGVARRPDLVISEAPKADHVDAVRHGPARWTFATSERPLTIRPRSESSSPSQDGLDMIAMSIVGPRVRQLLRASAAAELPPVGHACATAIGGQPVWLLAEAIDHALVVLDEDAAPLACAAIGAAGGPLGMVFLGQPALHRLAAARWLTLS